MNDEIRTEIRNAARGAEVPLTCISATLECIDGWTWTISIRLRLKTARNQRKAQMLIASGSGSTLREARREAIEDVKAYRALARKVAL